MTVKPQRKKVEMHLARQISQEDLKMVTHGLNAYGIKYTVIVDKIVRPGRRYPYYTVNGSGMCIKRIIRAMQSGNL
jgi:hypothetical protein